MRSGPQPGTFRAPSYLKQPSLRAASGEPASIALIECLAVGLPGESVLTMAAGRLFVKGRRWASHLRSRIGFRIEYSKCSSGVLGLRQVPQQERPRLAGSLGMGKQCRHIHRPTPSLSIAVSRLECSSAVVVVCAKGTRSHPHY